MAKMLRYKLVKSTIGYNNTQKATADALGLRRINQQVERVDNPQIRGMVNKIIHLVEVEEVEK
jgi:large subunit ribosomal protein L30